ncbi:chromosome transmission fidelity protein 18 homolog [Drosophila sulfurigaster albostrigata]|uniref:chromosome transmission fidelity protein 18 homolog n=1 Tax=Drosophila sulfurigaster albostrigata TaxID=89887 RepID=UPI002D21A7AC|nr:chromosome transmission fidelity protein 18 homolog [Drosophila sulfurigaster albostrigata]
MDQYPDENEEFELQYQDELELLEDMPHEYDAYNDGPSTSHKAVAALQKRQVFGVDVDGALPTNAAMHDVSRLSNSTISSPQLSQITFGATQIEESAGGGQVNRRLFGTPKGPTAGRGCSTPFHRMPAIKELASDGTDHAAPLLTAAAEQLQELGLRGKNKRRLERDLFGDIDDLYHESYEDPMVKKARTEEQRDNDAIERILELRRKMRESSKTVRHDDVSRLKALHDFKMKNLSYEIPSWPFLALQRSDLERLYVRYHSEDYERRQLELLSARGQQIGSLLGEAKQQVWQEANELVLRRMAPATQPQIEAAATPSVSPETGRLWVDKYKPRKYIDLLSDEMTNRSLLYWLKMWDKVVFGKAFHSKQEQQAVTSNSNSSSAAQQLNSFNKRTGKFESNGGWRQRKTRQALNTNVDELGRPMQKVALLCGPPGLGKTTLAHTIARHAGYNVREINASDDRSPEAFKLALENGTQMSSVLNQDKRPNCIVLDEIDGAPKQSIEYLVKFVSDGIYSKVKAKGAKAEHNVLRRPIICICNDIYDPALRPLRQIAFVVNFPPIDAARLAERLLQISRKEQLKTDFGSLIALAEKSGNDVRSCISSMQFFNVQKHSLTLQDVLNNNLGQKDRHQGLFDVWGAVFRIQRPKKMLQQNSSGNGDEPAQVTMTNMSVGTRVRNVLDVVHSSGDYERLAQGVYENYLQQKMPDPNFNGICEALQWFCFTDALQHQISRQQNYSVYPYLQYGFVVWHLLFATLAWPKIAFPTRGFEFNQKCTNQRNIFLSLRKGITSSAQGVGQGNILLLDTVPLLKRILSPQLRSVAVQLLSQKEQYDLRHTIQVMVDLGVNFIQVKSSEGHYVFQTEPDLDTLCAFPGIAGLTLPYFSRQLIAREVDLERIRRAAPKGSDGDAAKKPSTSSAAAAATKKKAASPRLPNHLQTLKPKQITDINGRNAPKQQLTKDFFGRVTHKVTASTSNEEAKTDAIVKSPIWYRYKEGYNNAVRKDVHLNELL